MQNWIPTVQGVFPQCCYNRERLIENTLNKVYPNHEFCKVRLQLLLDFTLEIAAKEEFFNFPEAGLNLLHQKLVIRDFPA